MRTNFRFKTITAIFAVALGIFISSCTKEESFTVAESIDTAGLKLKNGSTMYDANIVQCDLIAGQNINAGKVIFSHDATNIYVTYSTTNGWSLVELHLYVGSLAGLPTNKKAVQIGLFPYSENNLIDVTTYTFTVPIANLTKDENGYTIAAHAIVKKGQQQETAWSNGCTYKPLITVKSKILNGFWAVSDGTFIENPNNYGCRFFATNLYEKDASYLLIGPYYPIAGQAGHVTVTDNGTNLFVTVYANGDLKLSHSYLYVGNMAGFLGYADPDEAACINYENFTNQMDSPSGSSSHAFTLPMPAVSTVSFATAFGSNRWGWLSYYKF